MEDDLVAAGRYVRLDTRGRHSGESRAVTVGFVEAEDGAPGSLLVAAGAPDADWAVNLLIEPRCRVRVGDRAFDADAEPLEGAEHARCDPRLDPALRDLGGGPGPRTVLPARPVEVAVDPRPSTDGPG